jgi:hypothetical protein
MNHDEHDEHDMFEFVIRGRRGVVVAGDMP